VRLWLDTEFNGFRGELISMALVADDGSEWYEVLPCDRPIKWVAKRVMPILGKQPIHEQRGHAEQLMAVSLGRWLRQFDQVQVLADWPEDISHFCRSLIVGMGERVDTPPLSFVLRTDLPPTADSSAVPHNALEDARALARSGMARSGSWMG
jgi:hypothetical protein